mgnify:CR=1 FL=1
MAVQLKNLTVQLSAGVQLTPTTLQMAWGGESLLYGPGIPESSTPASTASSSSVPSLNFSINTNSMYIPLMVP